MALSEEPTPQSNFGMFPGTRADDPVKLAPETYSVLFENDRLRVLDVRLPRGQRSPMHSHPAYLIYSLSRCRVRFTFQDSRTMDVELEPGQTTFSEAETHAAENIGPSDAHVLNIELKQ